MNDALLMGCGQPLGQLQPDVEYHFFRESTFSDSFVQGLPRNVFHYQKVQSLLRIEIEDRNNIGMVQLGEGMRLFAEEVTAAFIRAERQYLQGNVVPKVFVMSKKDLPHSALADLLDNAVVTQFSTDQ